MIYIGPKFLSAPSALMTVTLGSRSHTSNFKNVKVFVYVFKTLLFLNLITEIHLSFDEYLLIAIPSPLPPPPPSPSTPGHVKIKVTEFSRNKICNIRRAILSGDMSCLRYHRQGIPDACCPTRGPLELNWLHLYNVYISRMTHVHAYIYTNIHLKRYPICQKR